LKRGIDSERPITEALDSSVGGTFTRRNGS
jgi:hypothetical protein